MVDPLLRFERLLYIADKELRGFFSIRSYDIEPGYSNKLVFYHTKEASYTFICNFKGSFYSFLIGRLFFYFRSLESLSRFVVDYVRAYKGLCRVGFREYEGCLKEPVRVNYLESNPYNVVYNKVTGLTTKGVIFIKGFADSDLLSKLDGFGGLPFEEHLWIQEFILRLGFFCKKDCSPVERSGHIYKLESSDWDLPSFYNYPLIVKPEGVYRKISLFILRKGI